MNEHSRVIHPSTAPRAIHGATLPVLGIDVRFESNAPEPIAIAEEAFGTWPMTGSRPDEREAGPVTVRIDVVPGGEGDARHAPLAWALPEPTRVVITSPSSGVVADAERRTAVGRVTEALVADRQHFRYGVLEACTLFILTRWDRVPVHAAAILRGGAALLLSGPSGAGKTTLAYAAATRLGCQILAEDVVYVQLRPSLRLWGIPAFLHLPVEAAAHFPELAREAPALMANGKVKIAVALARIGALPTLPSATRAGICVLERGTPLTALEPLAPPAVVAALTRSPESGFDLFADVMGPCIAAVAAGGGWRLRTTARPEDALESLDVALGALAPAP